MLIPKYRKYKKAHKGHLPQGVSIRCNKISFGNFALKSIEPGKITSAQIESARKVIVRKTKKVGKLWIRLFPDIPVSKKPAEVRMGKGKGAVEYWIAKIKAGRVLFELDGINKIKAFDILTTAASKLPVRTKIISKLS